MKVFLINATSGEGSTGAICVEIMEYLKRNGHECKLFFGNGTTKTDDSYLMTPKHKVRVHSLLSRLLGLTGYFSVKETNKLIKIIKKEKPDIVHLHNLHGCFIHITKILKFLRKENIITFITLHDCFFYTGKCTHYTNAKCFKWKDSCGKCPQLKRDVPSYFFDFTSKMLNDRKQIFNGFENLKVIAVSDWIKGQAEQSILSGNEIKRIYNWIDLSVFNNKENFKKPEGKFSVIVASAKWENGTEKYSDLLEICKCLPSNIEIKMVGQVEEGLYVPPRVNNIGYVRHAEEMANLFNSSDVYLHLSHEDSFGKLIAESMACGTPVIVYNSTACPELVEDGCGFKVEVGDFTAIKESILTIQKERKERYSLKCIEQARRFSKEKILEETVCFYEESVRKKG